jgi:hypothetical protein
MEPMRIIESIPLSGAEVMGVGSTVSNFFNMIDTPMKIAIGIVGVVAVASFAYATSTVADKIIGTHTLVYEGGQTETPKATNYTIEWEDGIIPFTNDGTSVDLRGRNIKSVRFS